MSTRPEELRDRTKKFALGIIRLFRSLAYRSDSQVLGKQLLRCGTSVAANYRAVCRARPRSKVESIARIGVVAEEADEAVLWLELLSESGIVKVELTRELLTEARAGSNIQGLTTDGKEVSLRFPITQLPNSPISQWLQ
jgi:four helix bundle protein